MSKYLRLLPAILLFSVGQIAHSATPPPEVSVLLSPKTIIQNETAAIVLSIDGGDQYDIRLEATSNGHSSDFSCVALVVLVP